MKKAFVFLVVCLVIVGGLAARPTLDYWQTLVTPTFRANDASRGGITTVVRATGTVKPVLAVQVGAFVSGQIVEIHADFNETIKKDDLIAKIDPRIYEAEVAREKAALTTANAEVSRVTALLQQAKNEEQRGLAVRKDNKAFVSDSELDNLKFTRMSLEAQVELAKANVEQGKARLNNAEANLTYTEIRSPVDGIVIDRKVELGQTVTATFATPVLFIVAPDLDGEMHVFASVDEADIGLVRDAQEAGHPVHFTVDAYPKLRFDGKVEQVRSSSTLTEGVVTFPVVVSTTNPDRKLLPGMTANLVFETDRKEDVLRVPNTAVRFFPPAKHVVEEDRRLLNPGSSEEVDGDNPSKSSQEESRRHVWISDGKLLRAVEVTVGISNDRHTEVVSGELKQGDRVVVGIGS